MLPVSFLLCAIALPGQGTLVSPAAYGDREGPDANNFPFGSLSQSGRYLEVHDDLAGTPRTILAFAVRRSATTVASVTPAFSVTLDGFMSTALTTGTSVDATFDNNHGADKVQVFTNRTIQFPEAGTGTIPYAFLYQLPLDRPFVFGGAGPLCWEVLISARGNPTSVFHDAVAGSSANPPLAVSRFGTACQPSTLTRFSLTGSSTVDWPNRTGSLLATALQGTPNAPSVFTLGGSATSYGGLPLPLLLPGTALGSSGPCYLHAEILVSTGGMLSGTGSGTFRVDVPLHPLLGGLDLYGQSFVLDPAANTLGIVSSNGIDHHFVLPYGVPPAGHVYAAGSLGPTGTPRPGETLVVRFTTT